MLSLRFTGNYGILGYLDYLHGTDQSFRTSELFNKHKFLVPFISDPSIEKTNDSSQPENKED